MKQRGVFMGFFLFLTNTECVSVVRTAHFPTYRTMFNEENYVPWVWLYLYHFYQGSVQPSSPFFNESCDTTRKLQSIIFPVSEKKTALYTFLLPRISTVCSLGQNILYVFCIGLEIRWRSIQNSPSFYYKLSISGCFASRMKGFFTSQRCCGVRVLLLLLLLLLPSLRVGDPPGHHMMGQSGRHGGSRHSHHGVPGQQLSGPSPWLQPH